LNWFSERWQFRRSLKGSNRTAQGNALGGGQRTNVLALKGRHNRGCANRLWRPFRAWQSVAPPPRALPWAVVLRPFGP